MYAHGSAEPPAGVPDWHEEWATALDRLELELHRAEQLLRANAPTPTVAWEPPVMRAPLPTDLMPRARLILERQLALANDVALAVARTRRELALTAKVAETAPPEIPVYLDVTA